MSAILTVVLPLFALIGAGALAGRLALMDAGHAKALNRFVFLFAMPAGVASFAASNRPPGADDVVFAGAYLACVLSVLFVSAAVSRRAFGLTRGEAGAHAFSSSLGNAVFLGLPIAFSHPSWAAPYLLLMLCEGVVVIAVGTALMTRPDVPQTDGKGRAGAFLAAARDAFDRSRRNPVLVGTLVGFALAYLRADLPGPIDAFLKLLGGAAGPPALFALGLHLATGPDLALRETAARVAALDATKLLILPALTITAVWFATDGDADRTGAAALFTAMPVGVLSFVQAQHHGVYAKEAAAAITTSTAISVLTISALLIVAG